MFSNSPLLFLSLSTLTTAIALPQGPNTFAPANPNLRTASYNATYFILPIPIATVKGLVSYPLLPVPISDTSLFPSGFPASAHPVLVNIGYMNDIRMANLQIAALMGAGLSVPYVDRLKDGKTAFSYPIRNWIGGVGGNFLGGVVPALVGSLEGTPIVNSEFVPNTAAYQPLPPSSFTAQVKPIILANTLSGPGVILEAVDFTFSTDNASPTYTPHTFHALVNQPQILPLSLGMCQRNVNYFNQTFTEGVMRTGGVTLYKNTVPKGLVGGYGGVGGYSASSGVVGFNAQGCADAAAQVDPVAVE